MIESLSFLAQGAVLGLAAGFAPGPVLTLVITETLTHSAREGFKVALSPLITDLPIILATLALLAWVSSFSAVLGAVALCGSAYLAWLGVESLRFRPSAADEEKPTPHSLRKGIIANFLNPHPYLFWITVGSPTIILASRHGLLPPALFILAFYVSIVAAKMCVAFVAGRFQAVLRSKAYVLIMSLLGVLLLVFAALLLKDGLRLIFQGMDRAAG